MSWLYSRALVAEFLAATCSDGAPSAPWSLNPTPQAYCASDKMTDFCRLSRYEMTFAALTDAHGAELLMWYREASRARTSPPRAKGGGIEGERSGLWREMHRVICEIRPRYAYMENSPMLTSRGLDAVQRDLAESGYDAEWIVLGADDAGAPHVRKRIWILALDTHANRLQRPEHRGEHPRPEILAGGSPHGLDAGAGMADTQGAGFPPIRPAIGYEAEHTLPARGGADVADTYHGGVGWRSELPEGGKGAGDVAHPNSEREQQPGGGFPQSRGWTCHGGKNGNAANAHLPRRQKQRGGKSASEELAATECGRWCALNPAWVEWLMGWPPGWTALKPWGTGKYRRWQRWHSAFYANA